MALYGLLSSAEGLFGVLGQFRQINVAVPCILSCYGNQGKWTGNKIWSVLNLACALPKNAKSASAS